MTSGRRTTAEASPARAAAFQILRATGRGVPLDRALEGAAVPRDQRPWVQELTYGVARLQGRLDHLLGRHLDRGVDSLPSEVRVLLRMGGYQGLYMGAVPAYAAVSETVTAVRSETGDRLAGLANAVLRRVLEAGDGPSNFPDPDTDPSGYLSTWGSHPRWLIDRWLAVEPFSRVAAWVEGDNSIPSVCIRPFRGSLADARQRLSEGGVETEASRDGLCLVLPAGTGVRRALDLIGGFVQDPAAALVSEYARPNAGGPVADLCAAPGGKSLALAASGHPVVSADPSRRRLRRLRENLRRLDARVPVVRARAQDPPFTPREAVLIDVPCTGTGTLRRHPDARWHLDGDRLSALVELQREILDGAASVVAPGGLLVYATCSLEPEENEEQVHRFLARRPGFSLEDGPALPVPIDARPDTSGPLRLSPDLTGYDGAFVARLRRSE